MTIYSFANGQSVEIYPMHKRKEPTHCVVRAWQDFQIGCGTEEDQVQK